MASYWTQQIKHIINLQAGTLQYSQEALKNSVNSTDFILIPVKLNNYSCVYQVKLNWAIQ